MHLGDMKRLTTSMEAKVSPARNGLDVNLNLS